MDINRKRIDVAYVSAVRAPAAGRPLPASPTTAPPGTPEKVLVFEDRAGRKEQLFHPYDARYAGDPRPLLFLAGRIGTAMDPGTAADSRYASLGAAVRLALLEDSR